MFSKQVVGRPGNSHDAVINGNGMSVLVPLVRLVISHRVADLQPVWLHCLTRHGCKYSSLRSTMTSSTILCCLMSHQHTHGTNQSTNAGHYGLRANHYSCHYSKDTNCLRSRHFKTRSLLWALTIDPGYFIYISSLETVSLRVFVHLRLLHRRIQPSSVLRFTRGRAINWEMDSANIHHALSKDQRGGFCRNNNHSQFYDPFV